MLARHPLLTLGLGVLRSADVLGLLAASLPGWTRSRRMDYRK
ncbi:hypothetical protein ACFQ9X_50830 [Catenulispora yoronensis]